MSQDVFQDVWMRAPKSIHNRYYYRRRAWEDTEESHVVEMNIQLAESVWNILAESDPEAMMRQCDKALFAYAMQFNRMVEEYEKQSDDYELGEIFTEIEGQEPEDLDEAEQQDDAQQDNLLYRYALGLLSIKGEEVATVGIVMSDFTYQALCDMQIDWRSTIDHDDDESDEDIRARGLGEVVASVCELQVLIKAGKQELFRIRDAAK